MCSIICIHNRFANVTLYHRFCVWALNPRPLSFKKFYWRVRASSKFSIDGSCSNLVIKTKIYSVQGIRRGDCCRGGRRPWVTALGMSYSGSATEPTSPTGNWDFRLPVRSGKALMNYFQDNVPVGTSDRPPFSVSIIQTGSLELKKKRTQRKW